MDLIKAIILGVVQGFTEFLPISSSGHLVLGGQILGFQHSGVAFEVFLHLGTLVAVLVVFRSEVSAMIIAPFAYLKGKRDEETKHFLLWDLCIIISTLPAVVVGLFFKDAITGFFDNVLVVYCMLLVTAAIMILTRHLPTRDEPINGWRSLLVGCAQACAILPGLSRSGSTIFMGMLLGIDREKIARFSFIMSIPAILGAAVLQLGDMVGEPIPSSYIVNIVAGSIASAISGYFAIKLLLDIIKKNRLQWFGYYCATISSMGLFHYFVLS